MSIDPTGLFLSLVVSGIGFVLFVYGKKQQRMPQLTAGLLMMVYPYFVDGAMSMAGIGAVIGLLLWVAIRLGW